MDAETTPALQRSTGTIRVALGDRDGRPQIVEAFQSGAGKLRFPLAAHGTEAMVLNTSGGWAAGDRFDLRATANAHSLTVSTQACERVYRSADGSDAHVTQHYGAAEGATLNALAQPTIVFDRARLRRRTHVDIARHATLTLVESLIFGRAAMGETIAAAHILDRIDVRIGDRLALIDALALTPSSFADAANPAGLAGARGTALVLHHSPRGPEAAVRAIRTAGAGEGVRVGASAVNGLAVSRLLASSYLALHSALVRIVLALTGTAVPRTWAL